MRNCPVCDTTTDINDWSLWKMYSLIPDRWSLPGDNIMCKCLNCGMIYANNLSGTQDHYDKFYRDHYGKDVASPFAQNTARLDELAEMAKMLVKPEHSIVDFGGGDGYLERKLKADGYPHTFTVDIGDEVPYPPDLLIMANVIEHLYEVKEVLRRVLFAVSCVLVEVPDAAGMLTLGAPILDYTPKHINHFTGHTLNKLFASMGYLPASGLKDSKTHNGFALLRRAYCKEHNGLYEDTARHIQRNVYERAQKLREIKTPVIVWGCGDLAMHLLALQPVKVAYYVDKDPAFRGATIKGIEVLDRVISGEPILILAHNQVESIKADIKAEGYKNEVVTV